MSRKAKWWLGGLGLLGLIVLVIALVPQLRARVLSIFGYKMGGDTPIIIKIVGTDPEVQVSFDNSHYRLSSMPNVYKSSSISGDQLEMLTVIDKTGTCLEGHDFSGDKMLRPYSIVFTLSTPNGTSTTLVSDIAPQASPAGISIKAATGLTCNKCSITKVECNDAQGQAIKCTSGNYTATGTEYWIHNAHDLTTLKGCPLYP